MLLRNSQKRILIYCLEKREQSIALCLLYFGNMLKTISGCATIFEIFPELFDHPVEVNQIDTIPILPSLTSLHDPVYRSPEILFYLLLFSKFLKGPSSFGFLSFLGKLSVKMKLCLDINKITVWNMQRWRIVSPFSSFNVK